MIHGTLLFSPCSRITLYYWSLCVSSSELNYVNLEDVLMPAFFESRIDGLLANLKKAQWCDIEAAVALVHNSTGLWVLCVSVRCVSNCGGAAEAISTNCTQFCLWISCGEVSRYEASGPCHGWGACSVWSVMWSVMLYQIAAPNTHPVSEIIVERAMKRVKSFVTSATPKYQNTCHLLPTLNICKRMFFFAWYALTIRRRGVLFRNLKIQLFLYTNQNYWGIEDIKTIFHGNGGTQHRKQQQK